MFSIHSNENRTKYKVIMNIIIMNICIIMKIKLNELLNIVKRVEINLLSIIKHF